MDKNDIDNVVLKEIIAELVSMGYSEEEAREYAPAMMEPDGTHG